MGSGEEPRGQAHGLARPRTGRRGILAAAGLLAGGPLVQAARAQDPSALPDGPIRIVVPLGAGGGIDAWTRMIAERLAPVWRVPVVVDNRSGANGAIGAAAVANAAPTGQTLLFSHSAVVLTPLLQRNVPYRLAQLAPMQFLADLPMALGVARRETDSLPGLIALAKARPGRVAYASYGTGSASHIVGEMLQRNAGIRLVHVPFRGEADAATALIGGQVTAAFVSVGAVERFQEQMAFAALAGPARLERHPEVPTFAELGVADAALSGWMGVFAPAGSPAPLLQRMAADIRQVLTQEEVARKARDFGFEPRPGGGPPFDAFVREQSGQWTAALKETGISIE
ncbi:tripartite tricarboxylate transporter substrate binding protein [Roseomonas chloroacetimidivorans]|uniref:tripartite tricarboxylate transporter substrate binding protein n=1 Tax=Roseomonas chloroacetimidivorans TaxID=1766656 RepID=UPI003C7195A2